MPSSSGWIKYLIIGYRMPLVEQDICGQAPFKRVERKKPKTRHEMYKITSISEET